MFEGPSPSDYLGLAIYIDPLSYGQSDSVMIARWNAAMGIGDLELVTAM